ncbi:MAG: hypothetical protein JW888_02370 [Pirellulales bacterium]|nr:hypothetical protein [Pirellulales bacterium]
MSKLLAFIRKSAVMLILLSLFVTPSVAADTPGPAKPILVVSSVSYDQWYENVALIGGLSGSPDLARGLEAMLNLATGNRGLAGLDKSRPWAGIVIPREPSPDQGFDAYACLPVDDLTALLEVVRPFTKNIHHYEGHGDGTHQIDLRNGFELVAIQKGNWAMVAMGLETAGMRSVDNPMRLLGDLPKRYDLAARLFVSQWPKAFETLNDAEIDRLIQEMRRRPDETAADYAVRRYAAQLGNQAAARALEKLDRVTVGLALDHQARQLSAEVTLIAKEGTPLARQWSECGKNESHLAGFRLPNAAATATWSGTLSKVASDTLVSIVGTAKQRAFRDINRSTRPERVELEREIASSVLDVIQGLTTNQSLEGTASVVLQPDATALIAAMRLPAGGQWPEKIEHLIAMVRRYPDVRSGVQHETDRGGEVRLHTLSTPIPDNAEGRQTLVRLFGEEIEIVIGAGKETLYVATGRDARAALKQALAASRSTPAAPTAPLECSLAIVPVAELAAELAEGRDRINATRIVAALNRSPGRDHVRLTVGPIDGGIRIRAEFEEGILRMAGLAAGMLATGQEGTDPTVIP